MLQFKQSVSYGLTIVVIVCAMQLASASVVDNSVYLERKRINSGDELISSILNNCYDMNCLKGNVLNYLNSFLNVNQEKEFGRSIKDVDEEIFDRVGRILQSNEFRFQLPETFFRKSEVTFRADRGFDVVVSKEAESEARGKKDDKDIKKKLLFPLLLLLKLKLKAILPIFVALIGIKALKALILSKLAITLVVGFIAYTLLKKPGAAPAAAADPTTTPSSYDPSSWEPSPGGPYARIWEPSAQNLAYSAYYPGSSSGSSSSSSVVTTKPSSSYTI